MKHSESNKKQPLSLLKHFVTENTARTVAARAKSTKQKSAILRTKFFTKNIIRLPLACLFSDTVGTHYQREYYMMTQSKILVSFSILLLTAQLSASEPKEHKQKFNPVKTDGQELELKGHAAAATTLAIAGGTLFSGAADGTIKEWDLETGSCTATFEGHTKPVHAIAVHPKATHVVSGADDGSHLWNIRTKTCIP